MKNRKRNRLPEYDYSNPAWYYVTICTHKHIYHFGEVKNGKMILNKLGEITKKFLEEIPSHYSNVELDEFIVMPNHIHAIIIINDVGVDHHRPRNVNDNNTTGDKNTLRVEDIRPIQPSNLSNVVKGFKIGVTIWCKNNNIANFKWQRSFYDRIIRNEKELYHIRDYIEQNPLRWEIEKNIENLDLM
ncbi:MAG: hypothetical protein M5R37_05425 [Melioribacteraceae bacterium]|nr:hypothetical protein [Melioribacteraceae bacterium]